MKKIFVAISILGIILVFGFFYWQTNNKMPASSKTKNLNLNFKENTTRTSEPPNFNSNLEKNQNSNQQQESSGSIATELLPPLDRVKERVTKKTFGLFITPANSPVQPEKFRGYHTGIDLEIFPEETNVDVSVFSACSGQIKMKKVATGYGGVLVVNCKLAGQDITAIYGHLKLSSINKNIGDTAQAGEKLGILGAAFSTETDGERKHLHFGLHKGVDINILGYVQNQAELKNWIDPCIYLCQ